MMNRRTFLRLTGASLLVPLLSRIGAAGPGRGARPVTGPTMIGVAANPGADASLMQAAGIEWVSREFPVPFVDRLHGQLSEEYLAAKQVARSWVKAGMKVLGRTPDPGLTTQERDGSGTLQPVWHEYFPKWCGPLGSEQSLRNYEAICAWMAEDLHGLISAWLVCNELECRTFAGPLNLRQACDLITAGARGLKRMDSTLLVGHNTGGDPEGYYLFGRLFADPHAPLDYCGDDMYPGSWKAGGPEDLAARIAELHAITGKPVVLNEFGFSSAGEPARDASGRRPEWGGCATRSWALTWGPGHTAEGQAEFVRVAFDALCAQHAALAGAFFYRWEDQPTCWTCGSPDCPIETRWGLVDVYGKPKPAYDAFREGVKRLKACAKAGSPRA